MRSDNRLFEVVELCELYNALKSHLKRLGMRLNDFNVMIGIMQLSSQHPTAGLPFPVSCVSHLMKYNKSGRWLVLASLGRLIKGGYVVRQDRNGPKQGRAANDQVNTYHLTKAGRDVINSYYEREFCKVKRRY